MLVYHVWITVNKARDGGGRQDLLTPWQIQGITPPAEISRAKNVPHFNNSYVYPIFKLFYYLMDL